MRAELQIPQSAIDTYYSEQNKNQRLERWKFRVEVLTFLAVAFYGWVAYRQWQEIIRSTDQAERAANVAEATQKAIDESSKDDRRAWVGIASSAISPPIQINTKVKFSIRFTNAGKTPAKNFQALIGVRSLPKEQRFVPVYDQKPKRMKARVVIHPGPPPISLDSEDYEFSPMVIDGMKAETIITYVYGQFGYDDIFKRHWTGTFCFYVTPDLKSLAFCDTYNDAN